MNIVNCRLLFRSLFASIRVIQLLCSDFIRYIVEVLKAAIIFYRNSNVDRYGKIREIVGKSPNEEYTTTHTRSKYYRDTIL